MRDKMFRLIPMISAILALLLGMWAGLMRIGWTLPTFHPTLISLHGPLMVCGFLGVLIGIERAVALSALNSASGQHQYWYFLAPGFTMLGSIALLLRLPVYLGAFL